MHDLPVVQSSEVAWTRFLDRPPAELDSAPGEGALRGKRVLITGAGGYIGSTLAQYAASVSVAELVLLDIAERGLFEVGTSLAEEDRAFDPVVIVGDVCDAAMLREIFTRHRPDVVFHAAACKHVSLMEMNPYAAARNNILGTRCVLEAAKSAQVDQVIVISTDKAVEPISMMGATKRVAELLVLAHQAYGGPTRVKAVRLANVLGSTGSVGPIFLRQIARGGPVTITDPACTRYFLAIDEVVRLLVLALAVEASSSVLIADAGEPFSVVALAEFLIEQARASPAIEMRLVGIRAGDKLTERMMAEDESSTPSNVVTLRRVVCSRAVDAAMLDAVVEEIGAAAELRDLARLLDALCRIVPAYRPSEQLRQRAYAARTSS